MSPRFIMLAALDLNQGTTGVLEQSLDMAASRPGCELHLVNVAELPRGAYPLAVVPDFHLAPRKTTEFCEDFLATRRQRHPTEVQPQISVHAVVGRAADEILWLATYLDADVIVMSTHGRRGLKRILLGSVAEKVVRLAGCPVFVVRDKAHDCAWRVPEIEPLCPDCGLRRANSSGRELWCARHGEHHARAHVLHNSIVGEEQPHAWSSATGT